MTDYDKKVKAAQMFKAKFPGLTGFKLYINEANTNEVDFMGADGLYCTINVRTGKVKGI